MDGFARSNKSARCILGSHCAVCGECYQECGHEWNSNDERVSTCHVATRASLPTLGRRKYKGNEICWRLWERKRRSNIAGPILLKDRRMGNFHNPLNNDFGFRLFHPSDIRPTTLGKHPTPLGWIKPIIPHDGLEQYRNLYQKI